MAKKEKSNKTLLPKDNWERTQGELGQTCNEKYATEMGNPEELSRSTAGLANYVRKNKMKQS
jgi:hypothetical protein